MSSDRDWRKWGNSEAVAVSSAGLRNLRNSIFDADFEELGLAGVLAPALRRGGNSLVCAVANRVSQRITNCFHPRY